MFLEMGTEDDRYPFLDLYLHRWQEWHQQVLADCSGNRRANEEPTRSLSSSNQTAEYLDFPYFQGVFNPYDW